jgi:RNase P subunit RPR2
MKSSKSDAKKKIEEHFSQEKLSLKQTKKIKKISMANRIRLGTFRKKFCKKCLSDLSLGKVRISKGRKIVVCGSCRYINKSKIN